MKRVSALFRPATKSCESMTSINIFTEDASAAPVLTLRRSASHSFIDTVNRQGDKDTNRHTWKSRLPTSGSLLSQDRNVSDAKKSSDVARRVSLDKLATVRPELRIPDYNDYGRYRNSLREHNMWRDPRCPETNWLKSRNHAAYKPDFAKTESNSIRHSFMRSPDEKSRHMLNTDLTKAVQKLRFKPSPPMSATAQMVRQAAETFQRLPRSFEQKSVSERRNAAETFPRFPISFEQKPASERKNAVETFQRLSKSSEQKSLAEKKK